MQPETVSEEQVMSLMVGAQERLRQLAKTHPRETRQFAGHMGMTMRLGRKLALTDDEIVALCSLAVGLPDPAAQGDE